MQQVEHVWWLLGRRCSARRLARASRSTHTRARLAALLAALLLPLTATTAEAGGSASAAAEPESTSRPLIAAGSGAKPQDADTLFEQARRAMDAGEPESACPKLEHSQRLDPGVGTLLYLAECYRMLGRTASAWLTFHQAARAATVAQQPERALVAIAEARGLLDQLGYLTIEVSVELPGLTVRRDGHLVPAEAWGIPMPVDPGRLTIDATAPDHHRWLAEVQIPKTGGVTTLLVAELSPARAAPEPPSAPPRSPAGLDSRPSALSSPVLGWSLVAAGGVGLGVGTALLWSAQAQDEQANAQCRLAEPRLCNAEGVRLGQSATRRARWAMVSGGLGALSLAGGITVLVVNAARTDSVTPTEQVGRAARSDSGQHSEAAAALDTGSTERPRQQKPAFEMRTTVLRGELGMMVQGVWSW